MRSQAFLIKRSPSSRRSRYSLTVTQPNRPGLLDWRRAVIALPIVALATLLLVVSARRRIGGATGDVCGAIAELGQLATLLVFAVR